MPIVKDSVDVASWYCVLSRSELEWLHLAAKESTLMDSSAWHAAAEMLTNINTFARPCRESCRP